MTMVHTGYDRTNLPRPSELARHWRLKPDLVFLNHGSYGACPNEVLAAQQACRNLMEEEPARFFLIELERLSDRSREAIGGLIGAEPSNLALLPNTTTAIATVIANLDLGPGDEVLVNDQEYVSCLNEWNRAASRRGFAMRCAEPPFPVEREDDIYDAVIGGITHQTRVCLISEITSPTALVLPTRRIVDECRRRGIVTIVDGAHAPGQIPVGVESMGCDFYAANMHKWVCAPKGSAVLWVHPKHQEGFEPLTLSSRAGATREDRSRFLSLFDYLGTTDYSPVLSVPDAIRAVGSMAPGGWEEVRERNRRLALEGRRILCERLGIEPPAPESMIASMASLIIPGSGDTYSGVRAGRYEDDLQNTLVNEYGIQVPVWGTGPGGKRVVRISAQLYNSAEQFAYLAEALAAEIAKG